MASNKYLGPGSYDVTRQIMKKSARYGTFGKPKSGDAQAAYGGGPGPG